MWSAQLMDYIHTRKDQGTLLFMFLNILNKKACALVLSLYGVYIYCRAVLLSCEICESELTGLLTGKTQRDWPSRSRTVRLRSERVYMRGYSLDIIIDEHIKTLYLWQPQC